MTSRVRFFSSKWLPQTHFCCISACKARRDMGFGGYLSTFSRSRKPIRPFIAYILWYRIFDKWLTVEENIFISHNRNTVINPLYRYLSQKWEIKDNKKHIIITKLQYFQHHFTWFIHSWYTTDKRVTFPLQITYTNLKLEKMQKPQTCFFWPSK